MRRLSFGVVVGGLTAGLLWAGAASAARKPPPAYFVKQRGWAQTLRLSREALLRQEAEQAAAGAKRAPTKKGAVVLGTWQKIGPFYNGGKEAFDFAFPPEKRIELGKSYGKLKWKACPQFVDGRPHGLKADAHGSTYLYRTLTAPKARKLNAFFGSDDGLAVWLNGRKIVSKNVFRGVSGEQDKVSLALAKGVNHLLLKVYNARGAHGFYFSTSGKARGGRRRGKDPRQEAREAIWALLGRAFRDPISQSQMSRERRDGIWEADWPEGRLDVLAARYVKAIRIPSLNAEARKLLPAVKTAAELAEIRALYHRGQRITEASALITPAAFEAVRLAVADLAQTFPKRYTKGSDYLKRLGGIEARAKELSARVAQSDASAVELLAGVGEQLAALRREALLANPLLDFDQVLLIRRDFDGPAARKVISNSLGMPSLNSHIHTTIRNAVGGWDDELSVLSDLRGGGTFTPVFKPEGGRIICDVDLHFDASRLLLSMCGTHDRWQVFELTLPAAGGPGAKLRQLTPKDLPDVDHFDACYLPNGTIAFTSTATFQGLPCEYGGKPVSQMFLMDGEGGNIRQITFDQDADWCPTVLNNGRLMYLRWEYTDTPHYFTRLLFHCNPDGTGQMEYYGSNSYFPNSFFFARPIPGHPTRVVGVAGGHHGISRSGRLLLLDPDKGRHEADGIVQEIPGRGKAVEPIIRDRLVDGVWPQFLHPYPLGDPPRAALGQPVPGAGKYFLVAAKLTPDALWGIYLADVFDNLTLIKEVDGQALLEPLPLRRTPRPPLIPGRVDLDRTDALVYLTDVYRGGGLRQVPRGAVKRLRVISYHYAYNRRGGHSSVGIESSWDIKRVLGTVPVEADGSAYFRIPANTPVAVQPLDAEGRALQLMRSWFVGMPGEVVSCVGCHESQNEGPAAGDVLAVQRAASQIEPWLGPARPFGFATEVQPVLDKFCVGCHDGRQPANAKARPNLADTSRDSTDVAWRPTIRKFSNSYAALQHYVRRPGPEGDYHMLLPMEYHAGTSPLIQMLKKGHHNVALDREGWDRLYTWIDLNAPYAGHWAPDTWREIDQRKRRCELAKRYANVETDPEGEYEKAAARLAARGPIAPVVPPRTPAPKIVAAGSSWGTWRASPTSAH